MAPITASLKLLIDTKGQRVIFAEASKDFVDFMFGNMTLRGDPVRILRLSFEEGVAGCLGNLYGSMEDLDKTYIDSDMVICRLCNRMMSHQACFYAQPLFTQEYEEYMIMDNLVVKPRSTISSINVLNSFNIKDVDCLEERVVKLSMDEGVKLRRASLLSTTVLTDIFLKKKWGDVLQK